MNIKLFKILLLCSIFYSCKGNGVKLYLVQYFQKGQKLEIKIDDGDYTYSKDFKSDYSVNSPILIKTFNPKREFMKIYFRVDDKDTIVNLPSTTNKVLFGMNVNKNLFLLTEKDTDAWLQD